jgi:hypothetical protein
VEGTDSDKRHILLQYGINYGGKNFIAQEPVKEKGLMMSGTEEDNSTDITFSVLFENREVL